MSKPMTAIGLMSGTSLDGIDVAMLVTDGETVLDRGPRRTYSYNPEQRELLLAAIAEARSLEDRHGRPGVLGHAENESTRWHVNAVRLFCQETGLSSSNIDVIGYHGQTVLHRPDRAVTVQLGDGGALAHASGIAVVHDMRAADMAHGGQGAPLVPVYHQALAQHISGFPVCIVNIGGVANLTWIGEDNSLLAFDTGPGNALIDDWMKQHTGTARDQDGNMGLVGLVDESVAAQFLGDSFFEAAAPKSLDRNSFSGIRLDGLGVADGAATLVAVTARAIASAQKLMPVKPGKWVICGGGRHNKAIMRCLRHLLDNVHTAEHFGLDGDAIEAEAWAFLAVRSLRGLPLTYPGTTGVREPVTGGVLVRPV